MEEDYNYLNKFILSSKKAINNELTRNLNSVSILQKKNNFYILYVFYKYPNDEDLESLSIIETEIVSDTWNWIGELKYKWIILENYSEKIKKFYNIKLY